MPAVFSLLARSDGSGAKGIFIAPAPCKNPNGGIIRITQVGTKSKMDNSKKRGQARRDGDVDPARRRVVEMATLARHSQLGRGSRTASPPETPTSCQSPARGRVSRTKSDVTTLASTITVPQATRRGKRLALVAEESRHRSATGVALQVPQTTPLTVEELCEGVLTEDSICDAAGGVTIQQLQGVKKLALVIDSSQVSIDGAWDMVPNLHTLALDGSRLLSFRDLGVGLRHLNTLSLESSSVEDLDGIGALSGLRELRLSRNRVSDVTPLACHGSLRVLDLHQNRVSDMNGLELLSSLPLLYSLNLALNPLAESLSELRDGKGREVVRQLIPQIRILDGIDLSSGEGGGVDEQILAEADDLVCLGASRARASWAMEKEAEEAALATASAMVSVEGAQGSRRRLKEASGEGEANKLRGGESGDYFLFAGSDRCLSRRSRGPSAPSGELFATKVQVGGRGSTSAAPLPYQGGIVHWDSDLTQGGREALFGNPSSAIRRHNWEKGHGVGRNGRSPTRVLETLDLAKIMEQGLKQRRSTQQSAERVSEWRRETRSDTVPPEDSPFELRNADVLPSRPCAPRLISSGFDKTFDRTKKPETDGAEQGSAPFDTQTATWASLSTSGAGDLNAVRADDEARRTTPPAVEGGCLSSIRPWTTGGLGRGSRRTASAAAAVAVEAYDTNRPERKDGVRTAPRGDDWSGRRQKFCIHPRRVRPQTAKEPGHRRSLPDSEDGDAVQNGSTRTSWQAVWESLQAERLICTPRVAQTAETITMANMANTGDGGDEGELVGDSMPQSDAGLPRKTRSVDFGRQRRARTTARAAQAGCGQFLHKADIYDSASGEEAGSSGGDDSDEVGDRSLIKKRASALSSGDKATPCVSVIPRPLPLDAPASSVLSPSVPAAMRIAAMRGVESGQEETFDLRTPESEKTPSGCNNTLVLKTRRRETASLVARRSLAVMDAHTSSNGSNSSSDDDDDEGVRLHKTSKSAGPRAETAKRLLVGNGQGVCGGRIKTSGVVDGESDSDSGGWSSSHRRTFSTHASRKLGFDLRKSLAAIDEWTDKAPAATETGDSGGGNPRQGESELEEEQKWSSCFGKHSPESSGIPASLSSPHDRTGQRRTSEILESTTSTDAKVDRERHSTIVAGGGYGARVRGRVLVDTTIIADDSGNGRASSDDDEGEAVMSVAEARAALGISKGFTLAARGVADTPPRIGCARPAPSAVEIDANTNQANKGFELADIAAVLLRTSSADDRLAQPQSNRSGGSSSQNMDNSTGAKKVKEKGQGRQRVECAPGPTAAGAAAASGTARSPGTAVGMSDEDLKGMLQKQPRTVPELRTKASFRDFFQGMKAERMGRLLRGAYEGNFPPDQVDKKIKKRLGLVGDILAW